MPLFVTLEGIEGSGKSSLQRLLAEMLAHDFPEIVLTREPGATALGRAIRSLLLDPANTALTPGAELALFAADRAQHVAEIIRPALSRGALVISDRYTHSTIAYQGYGRGLPMEQLKLFNDLATAGLVPDLVLLLDLPVETGLQRARVRAGAAAAPDDHSWSRFEAEELSFHGRIRAGYLALAQASPDLFTLLDAAQPPQVVAQAAAEAIRTRVNVLAGRH